MFTLQVQLNNSNQVNKVAILAELLFNSKPIMYGGDAAGAAISLLDSLRVFVNHSWDGLEPEVWEDLVKELRRCADSVEAKL